MIVEDDKVDASKDDHLSPRGPTHFQKTHDHHLMQLWGPEMWGFPDRMEVAG